MGAGGPHAGGVGAGEDTAFADGDRVAREERDEAFAEGEVGREAGEIAVVDADDFRAVGDGAVEFGFVMDFKQRVEARGGGGGVKRFDFVVGERANDDQNGAGAGLAGLEHLDRMHHEILAQTGEGGRVAVEEAGDSGEIGEGAAEIFIVGEDGERAGPGDAVAVRLVGRGDGGGDGAGGGRAALDLGDDGELAVGGAQGGAKRGRRGPRGGSSGEFGIRHGTHKRGDFPPFPSHDLGEFIGHAGVDEIHPRVENQTRVTGRAARMPGCGPAGRAAIADRMQPDRCTGRDWWRREIFRVFGRHRVCAGRMSAMDELKATIARLRGPGGCPWDQEQTHATLVRCLIDEVSELIDAIDREDFPHMREELGDVLIQVIFHAQLAEEAGRFSLEDVAREVNEKLVRRHPHVFGTGKLDTAEQVITQWEQIKAGEKKNGAPAGGAFKALPPRLPALMFAEAVAKQIEKKQLPADGVIDGAQVLALGRELDEATLGRRLFELAAAARANGLDAEGALRLHATKVMRDVEQRVQQRAG